MATLDDKLLGEKTHYYCSSSEDEDDGPKVTGNRNGGPPSDDFLARSKLRRDFSRKWDNSVNVSLHSPRSIFGSLSYQSFANRLVLKE